MKEPIGGGWERGGSNCSFYDIIRETPKTQLQLRKELKILLATWLPQMDNKM